MTLSARLDLPSGPKTQVIHSRPSPRRKFGRTLYSQPLGSIGLFILHWAATGQPTTTANIPPSRSHDPSNIPLRNLASSSHQRDDDNDSTALIDEKEGLRHRRSTDSAGSDFSFWSDTGDLAEQLAEEEDPLRINLRGSIDDDDPGRSRRRDRRLNHVHWPPTTRSSYQAHNRGLSKEAIEIPEPPPRVIGRVEYILAIIMTGNRSRATTNGLTGRPLLYVYNPSMAGKITHET